MDDFPKRTSWFIQSYYNEITNFKAWVWNLANEGPWDHGENFTGVGSYKLIKIYYDQITDNMVVAKIRRSLTIWFDHVVSVIEESKDFTILTIGKFSGLLQAHKVMLKWLIEEGVLRIGWVLEDDGKAW